MKYKIPHRTYIFLLLVSVTLSSLTFFIRNNSWNTLIASIGAGGVSSVCVAWMIDARNTRIQVIENEKRTAEIMNQFIRIYRRLFESTVHECYGHYSENECRSFQDWLILLKSIEPNCPPEGQASMKTRCTRVSGSIVSLQRQIEIFQSQSATLIFQEFPDIEQTLKDLEILWIHCWGTLKLLESNNYSAFCDTTYILYTDFTKAFPQYQHCFPNEYSINSIKA